MMARSLPVGPRLVRLALGLVLGAAGGAAPAAAQLVVRAENPIDLDRPDETVALPWTAVLERLPPAEPDRVRVVDPATGVEMPSQTLDADGDGAVDSLLFVAAFRPREVRRFSVEARAPAGAGARVFVMHDDYRDDVAWESDRVAFRMYGQGLWQAPEFDPLESSGIDVWLKRVRDLVVRRWYDAGHDAYHLDTGEGADFFTVGPSLGAGGTAVRRNGTLYRALNFRSHRILASGPVRVVFELRYDPWDAGGIEVTEVKRISRDAGQNLFRQEITLEAPVDSLPIAAGTVKRPGLVGTTSRAGEWAWMSTWGPVERNNGGHGHLGTGLVVPDDRLEGTRETDDHYLVMTTARPGEPVVLYAGAGWTASGDFDTVEDWWAYLDAFAERLAHPLRITLGDPP
jgi:pectinesterase